MKNNLDNGIDAFNSEQYDIAIEYLLPLAKSGNAQAQCYMGSMYQLGLGVAASGIKAVKWHLKAAVQNVIEEKISALAYHNLSMIYGGVLPDVAKNDHLANYFHQRAIQLGFDM